MARMSRERSQLLFFRLCLAIALTAITFLATASRQFPIISTVSDKLNHLLAFFVLAILADRSFPGKTFWLMKALPLMAYGVLIECIQYFIPCRELSLLDMAVDGAGLILYGAMVAMFNPLRMRIQK